jgi:hypothetical protein
LPYPNGSRNGHRCSRRRGHAGFAADLRLAAFICRRYASLRIAEDAGIEPDAARRRELIEEAARTWVNPYV